MTADGLPVIGHARTPTSFRSATWTPTAGRISSATSSLRPKCTGSGTWEGLRRGSARGPGWPACRRTSRGYRWVSWKAGEGFLGLQSSRLFVRNSESGRSGIRARRPADGDFRDRCAAASRKNRSGWTGTRTATRTSWPVSSPEPSGSTKTRALLGRPKFLPPVLVAAADGPIRITRDGVFGGKHWHGMAGYPSVACEDWDGDGLFDLIVPNETNRVFWYRNTGRHGAPAFGERRQILPDGFTDSAAKLEKTRRLAEDRGVARIIPTPWSPDVPFFWRTRLAIADYTGDGLTDLIALDGLKNLVLYARYRNDEGRIRASAADRRSSTTSVGRSRSPTTSSSGTRIGTATASSTSSPRRTSSARTSAACFS